MGGWLNLGRIRSFPKAILVLKESHRENRENCLTCMLQEWKDIQLDRLGEFREGLKVICGAEYLELEDRKPANWKCQA